ncbi:MAG: hypothetical protein EOO59_17350 [Hymenobacter sp.]|nr:MAG: hypothetical protein EOO59_17350 [Hymenobacter sp.]
MKKPLLLGATALLSFGLLTTAQAQVGPLVNLIGAGIGLGARAALSKKKPADQLAPAPTPAPEAAASTAPQVLAMQRTPTDKLPKKGAEQIAALEAQLEQCHAAMLASPTGTVCTAEQRAAITQAARDVARAQQSWSLQPYQQEMAFYLAEDTRRQQPAAPAAPAK